MSIVLDGYACVGCVDLFISTLIGDNITLEQVCAILIATKRVGYSHKNNRFEYVLE